jgi:hypothetical protein
MNLHEGEKNRLLEFLGYGNRNAQLWFLGMEEGSPWKKDEKPRQVKTMGLCRPMKSSDDPWAGPQ